MTFFSPIPPREGLSDDNLELEHIFGKLLQVNEKFHDRFGDTNCIGIANLC
jgi:hypothetical protein